MMAGASNVGPLAALLETVLQDNRELFLEINVINVVSRFKRENPVLAKLEISDDLRLDRSKVPDSSEAALALSLLVFTIKEFLEIFVGSADSEKRIGGSVARFTQRVGEPEWASVAMAFPELFRIGVASPEANIEDLDELEKAKAIFIHLFLKAAEEAGTTASILPELKKCPCIKKVSDDLASLEFSEGVKTVDAIGQLAVVVERSGLPLSMLEAELSGFGRIPDELGLLERLFGGALSRTTKFGCEPIDALLRNGIGRDETILLEGPSGVEKETLAGLFLREGLERDGCVIVVSSACSFQCLKKKLEALSGDMASDSVKDRLIFVDWHSRHTERITSIDADDNIIKVSNDLTNLAVGIDMALRKAKAHTQIRLMMDIVSPTCVIEGFDRVHDFLNSLRAKLKNAGCTGLILINQSMHPSDQLGILEDIFDGTVCIERAVEHGKVRSTVRVTAYSGGAFSAARVSMSVSGRGLEIANPETGKGPDIIHFDHDEEKAPMGLPGIESISADGLPLGSSFLVWMPSSMMPADYVKPVVMEAQKEGHAILLALSSVDSDAIGEWMSENNLSRKGLIDRGMLQIVDWYGQKSSKVLGMEIDEGIIRTSKDLTHLGVGIDLSLRKISEQMSSLAVLEVLSPALRLFDIRTVYSFAQSMNAKLANRGFTSFALMERDAHDPMTNAAMEELFDGIIDIRSSGGGMELGIISIRGSHFQQEYRLLTKMRDRLNVDIARNLPDAEIAETIAAHGLTARLKNLEKELDEALKAKGVLETRLKELAVKESEYDRRHAEMLVTLSLVEDKLKKQSEMMEDNRFILDPKHREEMARLLQTMDGMLESLPEDVIQSFARSDDFKLYEKILTLYLEEGK
jgi:KaiC/GvpD/RAD55 family RecA-like ATPase